tara:strand:+ start:184 stop:1683 length:1500 start_codon:yes stop_codon:yes gene_type:complete
MSFSNSVIAPIINNIINFPRNNAFYINDVFYNYEEFGKEISKIREKIKSLDTNSQFIGLIVNDDLQTYAAIISIWLEGKAYIPIHPNQPFKRNKKIIEQIGLKIILDSNKKTIFSGYSIINLNELKFKKNLLTFNKKISDEKILYILFTSGSTGNPKGVKINRKNISSFFDSFWNSGIKINETDNCLQSFDLTFDVSLQTFLAPLIKGACVFTVPHNQIKFSYIFGLLEDHKISFGVIVPSLLRFLRPYFNEIILPKMKTCIITAEACSVELALNWMKCIPNAQIYNYYGPTEATIYCTYYKLSKNENREINGMLSIGRPMKNVQVIIVDEKFRVLPKGKKGELCLTGDQITPGYWKNSEKNKSSFFIKSYKGLNRRFYSTGDICSIEKDNLILLYGRLDSQIKIQGYRIEIGEIEFHSREFLKKINTIVIPFEKKQNTELAIFIESIKVDKKSFVNYLKTKLPLYMIPSKIFLLDLFPLNPNGKIDKIKLKKIIFNST